jgi:hypothetical protein
MTLSGIQPLAIAAAIGLLSGAHTSIWGMYKDAVHEGFDWPRFSRSMIVGLVVAVAIQATLTLPLPSPAGIAVLFGLAYAAERGVVEVWKTFVRDEDQSKYTIAMQFSIRGKPVASRAARLAAGVVYVAAVGTILYAISQLDHSASARPSTPRVALIGLVTGLIVAAGGGWKDAPAEGFDPIKFFRSPALCVIFALVLSALTNSYLLIAAASIGYERASAETYKTFFFPSKPRGKFQGKPVLHPEMLERRKYFVPVYVAISAATLVCIAIAI